MSYLPDVYRHFERAFPEVHIAHQDLAQRCYDAHSTSAAPGSSSSGSPLAPKPRAPCARTPAARLPSTCVQRSCVMSAYSL